MGFLTIIQHMTLVQLQPRTQQLYIYLTILPLNLKQHKHEQAFIIERERERDHGRRGGVEEKCRNPPNESGGSKSHRSGGLQKATRKPPGRNTAPARGALFLTAIPPWPLGASLSLAPSDTSPYTSRKNLKPPQETLPRWLWEPPNLRTLGKGSRELDRAASGCLRVTV